MKKHKRKWIQKVAAAALTVLVGFWLLGLARDGTKEVMVSSIESASSQDESASSSKTQTTLHQFMGAMKGTEDDDAGDNLPMDVLQAKEGKVPKFRVILANPKNGKEIKGFKRWIRWQAFKRNPGAGGRWMPVGKPGKGKSEYTPSLPSGDYILLAAIPPFKLQDLASLDDQSLFKLLLQGANKDRRAFVGLRVIGEEEKNPKQGKQKPPPPPNTKAPPTKGGQQPPAAPPPSRQGSLASKTEGDSETGDLEATKEQDSEPQLSSDGSIQVPPRKDSSTPTLQNLAKLKVEGILPEIELTLGDFSALTHDEIKQLHSRYGVAIVLEPSPRFGNIYRNGFAVIDPVSGGVSDLSKDEVMNSLGRKAIHLSNIPNETLVSLKGITQTNAWLHWDGGYQGLHFANALLIPYQKYAKESGKDWEQIKSIKATLALKRTSGGVEIITTDLNATLKDRSNK